MPANPALTVGVGRSNTQVSPQPGMLIEAMALADTTGDVANVLTGGQLTVAGGTPTAGTTLNAVTANAFGTTVDAGSAMSNWTAVAVVDGAPTTGTLILELSLDNSTWVSSNSTYTVNAAGTFAIYSTGKAARYARVSLYGLSGTITLTVKMMGGG